MDSQRLDYLNGLVDKLYTDTPLLAGLLDSAQEPSHPKDYLEKKGFKLEQSDWKLVDSLVNPGPHFNLRLAGGAYRVGSNSLGIWEILVNSYEKKIYGSLRKVDGLSATSQEVKNDGSVVFSTASHLSFQVTFQCAVSFGDGPYPTPQFKGNVWHSGNESAKAPIAGLKCFPWGNIFNHTSMHDYNAGITTRMDKQALINGVKAREDAGLNSLAVALDIVNCQKVKLTFDLGDLLVNGAAVFLCFLGMATGKYTGDAGGAVIGALGGTATRLLALEAKKWLLDSWKEKLNDMVASWRFSPKNICSKEIDRIIKKLDDEYVREKDIADQIREGVKKKYILDAIDAWKDTIASKFKAFKFWANETFWATYKEALGTKFDQEISKQFFKKTVQAKLDERLRDTIIVTEIKGLQEELAKAEEQKKKDLEHITESDPQKKQEQEQKIEDKFKKDKEGIEKDQKEKDEERRKLERRDLSKEYKNGLESIEKDAEGQWKHAEEMQIRKRNERARKGYGEVALGEAVY